MDTFFDLHGKITATGYYGTTFECASGIHTEEAQENMHCNIFFIFCLSISDVMFGATGQVLHALWLATSIASENLLRNAVTNCFLKLLNYFFQTSSQLVFIIAIDRYIHMKCLGKYNTIITQARARSIIFFNVILGISAIIPAHAGAKNFTSSHIFSTTIFLVTCGILLFIMYIKAYMSIRRLLEGLSSSKQSNIAFHHNPEKVLNPQEKLSGNERCCGSLKAKVYKNTGSGRAQSSSLSCLSAKGSSVLEPQSKVVMLSKWPVTRTTNPIINGEQLEERRATANLSRVVENDTPLGIPLDLPLGIPLDLPLGIKFENTAHMKSRKATVNQSANIEVSQTSQWKIPKAQRQIWKAIIYIFISLF